MGFPGGSDAKSTCQYMRHEIWVQSLGQEDSLRETATHSNIPAWRIPQAVGPGRLQSLGVTELDTTEQLLEENSCLLTIVND